MAGMLCLHLMPKAVARSRGLKRFFTGRACVNGHVAERFVASGACRECNIEITRASHEKHGHKYREAFKSKYWANRDAYLAINRANYEKYKPGIKASNEAWRKANAEKVKENKREYYAANKGRLYEANRNRIKENPERNREYQKRYRDKNRDRKNAWTANRRARKANATPQWVDLAAIESIYVNCPEGMTVDHFIPLSGITAEGFPVSGLHVPWNLRYMTHKGNSGRCNRMTPDEMALAQINW